MRLIKHAARHRVDVEDSTHLALAYLAYSGGLTMKELVTLAVREYTEKRLTKNWKEVIANDEDFQQEVGCGLGRTR